MKIFNILINNCLKLKEKPNWIEKYLRRDMTKYGELSPVQYMKMFDASMKGPEEKK